MNVVFSRPSVAIDTKKYPANFDMTQSCGVSFD